MTDLSTDTALKMLDSLPNELLGEIFEYLDFLDLKRIPAVNKHFRDLISRKSKFEVIEMKLFRDSPNPSKPNKGPFQLHPLLSDRSLLEALPAHIIIAHKDLLVSHTDGNTASNNMKLHHKKLLGDATKKWLDNWQVKGKYWEHAEFLRENALSPATSAELYLQPRIHWRGLSSNYVTRDPKRIKIHSDDKIQSDPCRVVDVFVRIINEAYSQCFKMAALAHQSSADNIEVYTRSAGNIQIDSTKLLATSYDVSYSLNGPKDVDGRKVLVRFDMLIDPKELIYQDENPSGFIRLRARS